VFATIDMARTLGAGEPIVAESIGEARRILGRVDSPPLTRLLDDAIASGGHAPAPKASSGARRPADASIVVDAAG
jgi:hypothetical protein